MPSCSRDGASELQLSRGGGRRIEPGGGLLACRLNLGWEFAQEVHAAIQNILAHPTAWTTLSKHTRRCLVRRFPYGVIYQVAGDGIRIVAVMHLNRRPGYWQDHAAKL